MFKKLQHDNRFLGYTLDMPEAFFFFGSRHVSKDDLVGMFPHYQFAFLKQVHGQRVVSAAYDINSEADGHFTSQAGLALVVVTADCVPILMAGNGLVSAIHAGWRGVADNIVAAAANQLMRPPTMAILGPHIRRESFEVGTEVAERLVKAKPQDTPESEIVFAHTDSQKRWVDLTKLVRAQLKHAFPHLSVADTGSDTKSADDFHSFRRDQAQAGRQYSFVVIKG